MSPMISTIFCVTSGCVLDVYRTDVVTELYFASDTSKVTLQRFRKPLIILKSAVHKQNSSIRSCQNSSIVWFVIFYHSGATCLISWWLMAGSFLSAQLTDCKLQYKNLHAQILRIAPNKRSEGRENALINLGWSSFCLSPFFPFPSSYYFKRYFGLGGEIRASSEWPDIAKLIQFPYITFWSPRRLVSK